MDKEIKNLQKNVEIMSIPKNIIKLTEKQIDDNNIQFKKRLANFEHKFKNTSYYKKHHNEFDDLKKIVEDGKERIENLKNFNDEPPILPELYNETKENEDIILKNIVINKYEPNINDNVFIFKGLYYGKPCFYKCFNDLATKKQFYEQKIYEYIKTRNEKIKPYYEDYFVKIYGNYKLSSIKFIEKLIDCDEMKKLSEEIQKENYIYIIITEDLTQNGETVFNYFINNFDNKNKIINVVFDLIYGIYLMNNKLKLMHNDLHFHNIFIVYYDTEKESKYEIEKVEYIRKKNYKVCFYDFDLSYLKNNDNEYLYDLNIIKNELSAKDIWTILFAIITTIGTKVEDNKIIKDVNIKNNFFNNIFNTELIVNIDREMDTKLTFYMILMNTLLDNDNELKIQLLKVYENPRYWSAFCVDNNTKNCITPYIPKLLPLEVLKRLLHNNFIFRILKFYKVNSFYYKYLKYKNKYLQLKNIKKY
jgi:hypothetical protein